MGMFIRIRTTVEIKYIPIVSIKRRIIIFAVAPEEKSWKIFITKFFINPRIVTNMRIPVVTKDRVCDQNSVSIWSPPFL